MHYNYQDGVTPEKKHRVLPILLGLVIVAALCAGVFYAVYNYAPWIINTVLSAR